MSSRRQTFCENCCHHIQDFYWDAKCSRAHYSDCSAAGGCEWCQPWVDIPLLQCYFIFLATYPKLDLFRQFFQSSAFGHKQTQNTNNHERRKYIKIWNWKHLFSSIRQTSVWNGSMWKSKCCKLKMSSCPPLKLACQCQVSLRSLAGGKWSWWMETVITAGCCRVRGIQQTPWAASSISTV